LSVPRYAARADANTPELVKHARLMGAHVEHIRLPVDLAVLWGGRWYLAEVKDPAKEGHKDEFTKDQKAFFEAIAPHGGEVWIWRYLSDVQRDLNQAMKPEGRR
jgi:hypothetical protein